MVWLLSSFIISFIVLRVLVYHDCLTVLIISDLASFTDYWGDPLVKKETHLASPYHAYVI